MKNLDFYYILSGFDNASPFSAKFTFTELANNEGEHKDTEMFYALAEQPEIFSKLELYVPACVSINRDDKDCQALIIRVPLTRYQNTSIS